MNTKFKTMLVTAGLFTVFSALAEKQKASTETTEKERQAISQKQDDLVVIEHADGSRSADLQGRFQMYSVAKSVNGKIVYSCGNKDHIDSKGAHIDHQPSRGVK